MISDCPLLTRLLAFEGFGVVGRLEFGVVDREFGVIGLLARDPDRKSGNW